LVRIRNLHAFTAAPPWRARLRFAPAALLALAAMAVAGPVLADGFRLGWPVDCVRGQDCWIVHHVDMAQGPGAATDFACGALSYDGHKGTDIALADRVRMAAGVAVLAAADGRILRVRDGEADGSGQAAELRAARSAGRECGNGVVIDHGDGWQSQYCHLRRGSVTVRPGQAVRRGTPLAEVGHSGLAQFPHLHLELRRDGAVVDPFSGRAAAAGCGVGSTTGLWEKGADTGYDPVMLYAAGFTDRAPDYARLIADSRAPAALPADSPALVFWILLFGAVPGDRIELAITHADGAVFARSEHTQTKQQIRVLRYAGRRSDGTALRPGLYRGTATLTRATADGTAIERAIERLLRVE